MVLTAPLMFYAHLGGRINVSVADLLVPLLALNYVTRLKHSNGYMVALSWALLVVTVFSWQVNQLSDPMYDPMLSVVTTGKYCVILAYMWISYWEARKAITEKDYRFLTVWTGLATILSCATVIYAVGGPQLIRVFGDGPSGRPSGSFEDPNLFATYLAISICVTMLAKAVGQIRWLIPHLLLQSFALIMTGSRGVFPALIVVLVLLLLYAPGLARRTRVLVALVVLPGSTITFFPAVLEAISPGFSRIVTLTTAGGDDTRFHLWDRAIEIWMESIWLGAGPGQYLRLSSDATASGRGAVAHSSYLQILSEGGLVGAAAFFSLPLAALMLVFSIPVQRAVKVSLIAGFAVIAISMASLSLENARFAWIYIGVAYAASAVPYGLQTSRDTRSEAPMKEHDEPLRCPGEAAGDEFDVPSRGPA